MKDAEDEAFDDLARRQGMWGGGFQAKRAMAADKQEPWNEDEWRRNNWRCQHGWLRGEQCEICNASLAPQPAQPDAPIGFTDAWGKAYAVKWSGNLPPNLTLYITPPQRPWVGLTDEEIKGLWVSRVSWTNNNFARAIEAKLKEKNT